MTVADPERFTAKGKPITCTWAFVELYNWRNRGQVHEIHGMVEFNNWRASTAQNPRILGAHRVIEISSVLRSAHVVPRDQERVVFMSITILTGISSINYMTVAQQRYTKCRCSCS